MSEYHYITHPSLHSLTHSLTHSLINHSSPTHSLTHSLINHSSPTRSLSLSLTLCVPSAESTVVERAPLLAPGESQPSVEVVKAFSKADHYKTVVDSAQRYWPTPSLTHSLTRHPTYHIPHTMTIYIHCGKISDEMSVSVCLCHCRNFINSSGMRMFSTTSGNSEGLRYASSLHCTTPSLHYTTPSLHYNTI